MNQFSLLNDINMLIEIGGVFDFYKHFPEKDKAWVILVKNVETGEPRFLLTTGQPEGEFGMSIPGAGKKPDVYFNYDREKAEAVADTIEGKGITGRGDAKVIAIPMERLDFIRKRVAARWKNHLAKVRRQKKKEPKPELKRLMDPRDMERTQQMRMESLLEAITIPWTGPAVFPDEMVKDFLQDHDIFAPGLPFAHVNVIAQYLTDCMDDENACIEWRGYSFNDKVNDVIDRIKAMVNDSREQCANNQTRIKYHYPDISGEQQY